MENENAELNPEEAVSPQSIEEMDDEVFEAYIESAKNSGGEVQAAGSSGEAGPADNNAGEGPYISFETKEDLQEYQNQTIGRRLKEIREAGEREIENVKSVLELAKARYGISDGKQALSRLAYELEEQNARSRGLSRGEYRAASELKSLKDEISYQKRVSEIQNEWTRQGEALKKIVPDFNLEKAFENPEFYSRVVDRHETLAEAYQVFLKKPPRRAISEIGNLKNGVAGNITHDVSSMSDREFEEYIRKIKNS